MSPASASRSNWSSLGIPFLRRAVTSVYDALPEELKRLPEINTPSLLSAPNPTWLPMLNELSRSGTWSKQQCRRFLELIIAEERTEVPLNGLAPRYTDWRNSKGRKIDQIKKRIRRERALYCDGQERHPHFLSTEEVKGQGDTFYNLTRYAAPTSNILPFVPCPGIDLRRLPGKVTFDRTTPKGYYSYSCLLDLDIDLGPADLIKNMSGYLHLNDPEMLEEWARYLHYRWGSCIKQLLSLRQDETWRDRFDCDARLRIRWHTNTGGGTPADSLPNFRVELHIGYTDRYFPSKIVHNFDFDLVELTHKNQSALEMVPLFSFGEAAWIPSDVWMRYRGVLAEYNKALERAKGNHKMPKDVEYIGGVAKVVLNSGHFEFFPDSHENFPIPSGRIEVAPPIENKRGKKK